MYPMFGKRCITVCTVSQTGITATIFSKTGKGIVLENKIENTSFQALQAEFGIKRIRILLPEQDAVDPILKAAGDAGMIVEASEQPSVAMARMASKVPEPFLLVYPQVVPEFICAIQDGNVLEVTRVDPLGSLEDTKHTFIEHVANTRGITVRAIATNTPDPVVGLAMKKDEKKRLPLLPIIGIIILLVVGIVFFSYRLTSQRTQLSPSPTLAATPTEKPIGRSQLTVEVQNGSGEAGLAGKGKKVLENLGYTTVTTASADNYEYQGVTVKAKTAAISAFVVADIKETYKNASASSTLLDSASLVDAIVILGK